MDTTLGHRITEKDRIDLLRRKVWGIFSLPVTSLTMAEMDFYMSQLPAYDRQEIRKKMYEILEEEKNGYSDS